MQEDSNFIFLDQLFSAVQSKDVDQVKHLLESGGVSLGDDEANMPLYAACELNNVEIVKLLLKHGADVNGGEDYSHPSGLYETIIHRACNGEGDRTELVKCLIDAGCKINEQDPRLESALTYATHWNNVPLINLLIESGADVNVVCDETPLEIAAKHTNVELMKYLLNAGADPSSNKMASLHTCLQLDFQEGVKLLYKDSQAMVYDMHEYCQQGRLDVFVKRPRFTMERGLSRLVDMVERSYRPEPWLPPLLIACSSPASDPWKVVQTLLDLGADVNDKDQSGFNCLQHACSRVNVKCVGVLLDNGVNPVDHSWEKLWAVFPPLVMTRARYLPGHASPENDRVATFQDYLGILKLLVSAGFKIDEESAREFTRAVKLPYASAWSEDEKTGFTSFLKNYRTVPMSLLDCCRIEVRQCLETNGKHSIGKLENSLPLAFMNYLRFGDILGPLI